MQPRLLSHVFNRQWLVVLKAVDCRMLGAMT
jgi:hypothetical protein